MQKPGWVFEIHIGRVKAGRDFQAARNRAITVARSLPEVKRVVKFNFDIMKVIFWYGRHSVSFFLL